MKEDHLELYDHIRNITVRSSPAYLRNGSGDKKEVIRRLEAFDKDNNFLHGWDYVQFRVDPSNSNDRFYVATDFDIKMNMAYLALVAASKRNSN